jgi:hypothetical protein
VKLIKPPVNKENVLGGREENVDDAFVGDIYFGLPRKKRGIKDLIYKRVTDGLFLFCGFQAVLRVFTFREIE